jgi:S1-C subfamily serine protease
MANRYLAGNIGGGVLRRFDVTFDYGHQKLYFQPNGNVAKPDVYDRTGMWLNRATGGFQVMDVIPGGPAAEAGLKAGDTITAIDGKPTKDLLLPEVRIRFRAEAPGTRVRLTVSSGGKERAVVVALRDLV